MDGERKPEPMGARTMNEVFSWEAYPRKIPRPPRTTDLKRLKFLLSIIIVLELIISAGLFIIPFTPDYTGVADVEGTFLDSSGNPVTFASVSVDTGQSTTTDIDGRFKLVNVPPGPRTFYFSKNRISHSQEEFVSNYHSTGILAVEGRDGASLPGEITDWKHLNGLFFGSALIVLAFASISILAYSRLKKPSIAFSACAMAVIASVLVLQTTPWMDMLGVALLLASLVGISIAYRVMKKNRMRILTNVKSRHRYILENRYGHGLRK